MSKNLPQTGCVHLLPYPGRPKLTNIQDSTFLGMWADMRGTRKRMVQRQENFFQRNTSVGSCLGTGHDRLARLLMRLNGGYFSLRGLGCFIHCARNLTHIHVCLCVQSQNRTTRSLADLWSLAHLNFSPVLRQRRVFTTLNFQQRGVGSRKAICDEPTCDMFLKVTPKGYRTP